MKTHDLKIVAAQLADGIYRFICEDTDGSYFYLSCENYLGFRDLYNRLRCKILKKDEAIYDYMQHLQAQREREISAIES